MMRHPGISVFIFLISVILVLTGCGKDKEETRQDQYEPLEFNIDRSLLAEPVTDDLIGISVSPPRGWEMLDESMLNRIKEGFSEIATEGYKIIPRSAFAGRETRGLLIIAKFDLGSATSEDILDETRNLYEKRYPGADIRTGRFLKGDLRVRQIMVNAKDRVIFELLIDGPGIDLFGVSYTVPRDAYASLVRRIESSIGSIEPLVRVKGGLKK